MLRAIARSLIGWHRDRRLLKLGAVPTWAPVGAVEMLIDPADWVDRSLYLGTYEPALQRLIGTLKPGEAAVDIGTHKGYFTLLMAQAVGSGGLVIAADPDPRAFAALTENCARNGFAHVRAHNVAVGDAPGACELQLTSQLGWSSRFPNELAKSRITSAVTVPVRTLDELTAGIAHRIALIKIDAEGSEPLILAGMDRTVREHRPTLTLEINTESIAASGHSLREIADRIRSWGYQTHALNEHRKVDIAAIDRPLLDVVCFN